MQTEPTIHSVGVKLKITAHLDLNFRGFSPIEDELSADLQKIGLDTSKCKLTYDLIQVEDRDFEYEIKEPYQFDWSAQLEYLRKEAPYLKLDIVEAYLMGLMEELNEAWDASAPQERQNEIALEFARKHKLNLFEKNA